jgi:hypothetical protein
MQPDIPSSERSVTDLFPCIVVIHGIASQPG